ncbi:MAG: hypothetical protein CMO55_20665 [Verrucomicrobiales bacterium]|nr:hypothetical protein [Verrucomicrobiales bacterium]
MTDDIPETSAARRLTAYSYLVVFANDGTIDEGELALLKKIALEDHIVDEAEKDVLRRIFSRVSKDTVTEKVWEKIEAFRSKHEI